MNDVAPTAWISRRSRTRRSVRPPSFRQLLLKHRDKESLPGPSVRSNYLLVVHPVIQIGQPATTEDIHGGRQIEGEPAMPITPTTSSPLSW